MRTFRYSALRAASDSVTPPQSVSAGDHAAPGAKSRARLYGTSS